MRKRIALLLSIVLLTGCAASPASPANPAPPAEKIEQITLDEETLVTGEAAPQEIITYEAIVIQYGDTKYAENDIPLFTCEFNKPHLIAYREDGTAISSPDGMQYVDGKPAQTPAEQQALSITEAFNAEFAHWKSMDSFEDMIQAAREDLAFHQEEGFEWTVSHFLEMNSSVYQTEQMVSVYAIVSSYTGGAHPNHIFWSWNFDLTTGEFFAAEGLASDVEEFSQRVTNEIIRQAQIKASANNMLPEEFFWEDYRDIAANWSSCAVAFDENGMTVGYSPYEMACYAAGPQEFELTYSYLKPGLSEHGQELLGLLEDE